MSKFEPGHGTKGGRPQGSRNKLVNAFIDALFQDFSQYGPAVIKIARIERPTDYLRIVAGLVPKELLVQESAFAGMSDEEIAETLLTIRKLKQSVITATEQTEQPPKSNLN
jgi:hypothetical protein